MKIKKGKSVKKVKLSNFSVNPRNPQTFTDLSKLKDSILKLPVMLVLRPIVYDPKTMYVLGGNKRLVALQELGYDEVPSNWFVSAGKLTRKEKKRFIIADNVGFGEWDLDLLNEDYTLKELDEYDLADLSLDEPIREEKDSTGAESCKVEITCRDEAEMENLYLRLSSEGLQCRTVIK